MLLSYCVCKSAPVTVIQLKEPGVLSASTPVDTDQVTVSPVPTVISVLDVDSYPLGEVNLIRKVCPFSMVGSVIPET